jgi:hypothetical protein
MTNSLSQAQPVPFIRKQIVTVPEENATAPVQPWDLSTRSCQG